LVVLNPDLWNGLAEEYDLDPSLSSSLEDERLENALMKRIRMALRDFPGYAKIRRVSLLLEPWTIDNGMMTPTLKIKRQQVLAHCEKQVEAIYGDGLV
jgi:long-chain acyl-CoA synthetase